MFWVRSRLSVTGPWDTRPGLHWLMWPHSASTQRRTQSWSGRLRSWTAISWGVSLRTCHPGWLAQTGDWSTPPPRTGSASRASTGDAAQALTDPPSSASRTLMTTSLGRWCLPLSWYQSTFTALEKRSCSPPPLGSGCSSGLEKIHISLGEWHASCLVLAP